jgi:hypothetical protein
MSVACLVLLLPLTGCAAASSVLTPEPEVVTREATVAVPAAPVDGALGREIPSDLPVWPEATVVSVEKSDGGSLVIALRTPEAYDDVVTGLGVGFERAGWQVTEGGQEAAVTLLDVSGLGYEGLVTIASTDAGTSIEYLLTSAEDGSGT